jgi:uncharacterized membrane protein YhaH (DUF805 family)
MSWREVFFGFHGRINRKTFWFGWLCVSTAGLLLIGLLAYLIAGDPASTDVWLTPAGKERMWVPIWLAWLAFLAWPLTALAIKRLHDRDRPQWLWYAYYCMTIVFSLPPLKNMTGGELGPAASAMMLLLLMFGLYVFAELAVLRGTPGPNGNGEDTLPAGYSGGDYSFLSLMLAWEGRISRAKWWLGILIIVSVLTAASIAMTLVIDAYSAVYPGLEKNMANPAWLNSPEAAPILFKLGLWAIVPMSAFALAAWGFLALSVKRLHDRGLSSWLILIVILPFLATIVLPAADGAAFGEGALRFAALLLLASMIWSVLQFGILKGETGSNPHGPDPLAGRD